jgi:hypothetical protein
MKRRGRNMATKIKLSNGPAPPTAKRVAESADEVSSEINSALLAKLKFVMLTDAETGKEFSVEPSRVRDIEAE